MYFYTNLIMKQTSKDKIINQSIADKIQLARELKATYKYYEAIEAYHRVLFLKQDAYFMLQLAEIYQNMYDLSSAVLFYRRAAQLNGSEKAQQKIKLMTKVQGLQLLRVGSAKNILQDTEFELFVKRYPAFHKKLMKRILEKQVFSDYLESCLAYLQVNQRQFALSQIENCIMIDDKDVDLIILRALLHWSLMQTQKGYKQFWNAYGIDKDHSQVQFFVQMITPELQKLYKEAKYDLIDRKLQKCKLKVKKGLQIHPYHTEFLILSAYLHRSKEEYELALADLDLANKHFQDPTFADELRNQISLTYNEMGIFFYRQAKYNEAITLFSQGLTFKTQDWGMYTNRGDCYRALSQYVKALEDYLKAYDFQKKNDELCFRIGSIYNIRGVALFNSKNYEPSLEEFEESIKYSPKCAQFYLSKAKCLLQLSRKAQSVEALQKCVNLDDKLAQASQLLQQLKQPEERKTKNNRKVIYLSKEK